MSNQEKLENLSPIGYDNDGNYLIKQEDYFWLQEQAERVEELEKELELERSTNKNFESGLIKDNQRYKQALEESYQELQNLHSRANIIPSHVDVKDVLNTIEYVGLTVIKQALQGGNDND